MSMLDEYTDDEGGPIETTLPSGSSFPVLIADEAAFLRDKADRYLEQNHVSNVTDLSDMDRVLVMELLTWRWGQWLSREQDYDGNAIDAEAIKKSLADYSKEIRLIKKSLGLDKSTRDREKGENFKDYLENLRLRAREFGIMREEQLTKAITLFQELKALITLHDNCTEDERREQNVEQHDLIQWIREVAIPEFDAVDEHFRTHSQKYWIRQL